MGALRRSSEVRQVELADAALHLIATKGITALTTRSLADEVGLTSGAIFKHFASLDALLEAVVARVEEVLASTYPSAQLPPVERLEAFLEARSTAVGHQLGILRLVLSDQFHLALPRRGSARLSACVEQTRAFVLGCLREGQRTGSFRNDLPAETLAPIVMGTLQLLALTPTKTLRREPETQPVLASLLALLRTPVPPSTNRKKPL